MGDGQKDKETATGEDKKESRYGCIGREIRRGRDVERERMEKRGRID